MLRTSRQSNYWGLVQQRGPWDETKIDIQNLRNTKVVNLGGGVDNGGTVHAGHAQWKTKVTPSVDPQHIPAMPNPSPYPQISRVIPGPPQDPITPGRRPRFLYKKIFQEHQANFHPRSLPGYYPDEVHPFDPSESYPPIPSDYDPNYFNPDLYRDLYTGPLGHSYEPTSPIFSDTSTLLPDTSMSSTGLSINSTVPAPSNLRPTLSYRPTQSQSQGPDISYSQISTPSVSVSEIDQTLTLPNGEVLTPSMPQNYQIATLYDQFSDTVSNFLRDPSQREYAVGTIMNIGSIIVEYLDRNNVESTELQSQLQSPISGTSPVEWLQGVATTIETQLESAIKIETHNPTILKSSPEPLAIQAKQLSEGIRVQSVETLQPLQSDLPEIDFKQQLVNTVMPQKMSTALNLLSQTGRHDPNYTLPRNYKGGITGRI